jgi:hypothetical protein
MRKVLLLFFLLILGQSVFALDSVSLQGVENEKVQLTTPKTMIKGSLLISEKQVLDELINLQKEKDLQDIEMLWKGTVENNKVIEFALKKLATPESQRRIHSSLMSKTLSAVISGSSLAPSFMGTDPLIQTSAFAAGRLAQTLLNKKSVPQEIPLTDTELIELATLVENLQDRLINAYYNYKNCLNQLKENRSKLILYNKNYAKALDRGDILDISISSALYDGMLLQEFQNKQMAKKYHLELQRLAGRKVVSKLSLYQYDMSSVLLKEGLK